MSRNILSDRSLFFSRVEVLEKDIKKEINKQSYQLEDNVQLNHYYLALDQDDDKYCRVKVTAIESDQANCFFVDYGDQQLVKLDNLKKLPEKYISVLPFQVKEIFLIGLLSNFLFFQAIECRLFGISPVLDCWCGEATDVLYDYCYEPNTDYFRTLYAVVCRKERATFTDGEKYSILLLDNFSGETVSIGNLMFDCGFASFAEGEELPAELPKIERHTESESEAEDDNNQQPDTTLKFDENETLEESLGDDWDLQIFNPLQLLGGKDIDVSKKLCPTAINHEEQSQFKALPLCEYRTPTVVWYQTDIHVKLNVQIPNVRDYSANLLRDRILVFRTNQNGVPYQLSLQLYGKVEKTFQHVAGGLSVKIILSKCRKEEWPRLTIQSNLKNIKYNMEMYQDAEDGNNGRKFLTLDKELDVRLLDDGEQELCIGSDFDSNSDSDVMSSD